MKTNDVIKLVENIIFGFKNLRLGVIHVFWLICASLAENIIEVAENMTEVAEINVSGSDWRGWKFSFIMRAFGLGAENFLKTLKLAENRIVS